VQQLKDEVGVAVVILLPPGQPSDLCRIADEYLVTQVVEQLFEPAGVATRLQADDHVPAELGVEGANVILLVVEILLMQLPVGCVQEADCL
jgi:hypothetical protein